MTKLDKDWAVGEINKFLHATDQIVPETGPGIVYFGTVQRASETEVASLAHVTEQIVDRVIPGWRTKPYPNQKKDDRWGALREWSSRAKAALERESELRDKLGDGAPEMDAGRLHPWAWESAAPLWKNAHYTQAVVQAAVRINAETQEKLGRRDISETKLFNEAFSLNDPKENSPRLRLMDDDGSDTYQSLHRGARALAEGLYAGVRNPAAHTVMDDVDEQLALEQLAAFSLLARWVDNAKIATGEN